MGSRWHLSRQLGGLVRKCLASRPASELAIVGFPAEGFVVGVGAGDALGRAGHVLEEVGVLVARDGVVGLALRDAHLGDVVAVDTHSFRTGRFLQGVAGGALAEGGTTLVLHCLHLHGAP